MDEALWGRMLHSAEPVPVQAGNAGRLDRLARWAVVVLLAGVAVNAWARKEGVDFHVFWVTGQRALEHEPLYRASDGVMPFKYAPPVALFLGPLGLLSERAASAVWLLLSAFSLWRLVTWSQRALGGSDDGVRSLCLLLGVTPFALHLLALGQSDGVLLLLAVESEALRRRAPLASGLLLALAALAKPPMLLFALLAVWRREGRRLLGLLVGVAAAMALTVLWFGPGRTLSELGAWRAILAESTPEMICRTQNQSLPALACTYLGAAPGQPGFQLEIAVLALLLLSAAAWSVQRVWRRDPPLADRLATALTFYGTALLSPLGWRTNLIALVPVLALLGVPLRPPDPVARWVRGVALGALALTIFLGNYEVLGNARFRQLLELRHYGLVAIWVAVCTVFVTLRRVRSGPLLQPLGAAPG